VLLRSSCCDLRKNAGRQADMSGSLKRKGDPSAEDFTVSDYLFYLVTQAMDKYEYGIEEVLKPTGFNKTRWRILMSLREQDGSSITYISEMTSIRRSTASRVVEQMEKEGLVCRKPNKEDNRVTEVFLKKRGADSLARILTVVGKQYRRSIQGIPASDLKLVKKSLRTIIDNLNKTPIE